MGTFAAFALLAGCGGGGDEPESADTAGGATDLSACSDVWQVGETLPDPYRGCSDDGTEVDPVFHSCKSSGGEGRYVEWDNGAAYAREGGPIIDTAGELARICD